MEKSIALSDMHEKVLQERAGMQLTGETMSYLEGTGTYSSATLHQGTDTISAYTQSDLVMNLDNWADRKFLKDFYEMVRAFKILSK